ncbi:hypothetical protein WOC76_02880 [Methylocystis sp. IM3]|jgi:hypothetical protein|uniref:hypothetical protein n=1 Tax=unclassified Methylocystis TaxID=2625913 RepID=UPI000FA8BCDB|nr:MAG: hypothetical protein EKK29_19815 [Hyphomicrobiales bacterium]
MLRTDTTGSTGERDYATLQRELGFALRAALSNVLWQPLPESIRLLLEQLKAEERRKEERASKGSV